MRERQLPPRSTVHCAALLPPRDWLHDHRPQQKSPRCDHSGGQTGRRDRGGRQVNGGMKLPQDQQPNGRFGRMGTMPVTRKVAVEPSVAVSVLPLKRT